LNTLGTALYRAGRYAEAIERFQAAIRAHETKEGMGHDWALLAMAYAKIGDRDYAQLWLDKALAAQIGPQSQSQWQSEVELRLLQQEAAEVVKALALPAPDAASH